MFYMFGSVFCFESHLTLTFFYIPVVVLLLFNGTNMRSAKSVSRICQARESEVNHSFSVCLLA